MTDRDSRYGSYGRQGMQGMHAGYRQSYGSSSTSSRQAGISRLTPPPSTAGDAPRTFVRALFKFEPNDSSALSFDAGDIIEVYTKLESGWWDGVLDGTRGWFPSNYVQVMDAAEVERAAPHLLDYDPRRSSVYSVRQAGDAEHDRRASTGEGAMGWTASDELNRWSNVGLDDLAREVMGGAEWDEGGENDEFAQAAHTQRRRQTSGGLSIHSTLGQANGLEDEMGPDDFGVAAEDRRRRQAQAMEAMMGQDEFGMIQGERPRRNREDTNDTVRALKPSLMETPMQGTRLREREDQTDKEAEEDQGEVEENNWIPTLTPDGQIFYHNPVTGEDSWDLPPTTPTGQSKDSWSHDEHEEYLQSLTGGSSSAAYANTSSSALETPDSRNVISRANGDVFRAPGKITQDLPHPWVARMSDDGSHWFFVNPHTGQTRSDRPEHPDEDLDDRVERLSIGSSNIMPSRRLSRPRIRRSVEIRRKHVGDWASQTRKALNDLLVPEPAHHMSWHMEEVNDAFREVSAAAVMGSAAEEEMTRAIDLGSRAGVITALEREEAAKDMLRLSFKRLMIEIRSLLTVFGYVGPLEGLTEMPRPHWALDMDLIPKLGILGHNVHSAVFSRHMPEGRSSIWQEVMDASMKVKETINAFPERVLPHQSPEAQAVIMAKPALAELGVQGAGEILGGRWGFSERRGQQPLGTLDPTVVAELARLQADFSALRYTPESVVEVMRAATAYKDVSLNIDLASAVDLDGDMSDRTRNEDAEGYADLVNGVQNALLDLEDATAIIDELCIFLLHALSTDTRSHQELTTAIATSHHAIASLLDLSRQQSALADRAHLKPQLGHRSPKYLPPVSARPLSMVSTQSRGSRRSAPGSRGLEEEFIDAHGTSLDLHGEQRDVPSELNSASASQTSLPQQQQQLHRRSDVSATSSTTSLAYQQTEPSDSGSIRGKRSSFMKFVRGKSGEDDGRGTLKSKTPSKKLAKLLGEDIDNLPQPKSNKLAKILGENPENLPTIPPPSAGMSITSPLPETPWYLGEDYAPEDITYDDKGGVRAGTLPALVAKLTPHGSTDTSFFQAFLLTFRSFTSGPELFDLLMERYNIPIPAGLSDAERADWTKLKQTPIRLRVSNTIRSWLDVHYVEQEDKNVLPRIERFARETLVANGSELLSKQLVTMVERRHRGEGETQRRIVSGGLLSPPAPLLPRVIPGRSLKLSDINPLELARQLTILEFGNFQQIRPSECLNKSWAEDQGAERAPHVRRVIHLANLLSSWAAACCLSSKDVKQRANTMKYLIQTAMELRNLNNFSSMASVMAGLNSAPILRLKRTAELLSQKTKEMKDRLDKTLDSTKNFQNYKDMLKTINPPCVPFFGFWLSALTFIEDGNRNYITPSQARQSGGMPKSISSSSLNPSVRGPNGLTTVPDPKLSASTSTTSTVPDPNAKPLINFFKRSLSAEILRDIQQYQSQPYNLARCKPVYEWMDKQLAICEKTHQDMTVLYDLSLQLEPREREEERITRMLHDSGFI